jgi:hypothetical protein
MLNTNTNGSINPLYVNKRVADYLPIEQQLDMIWHELKETGTLSTTGAWYTFNESVKEQHPKPSEEESTE